jgi:hypothetical protein
MIHHLLWFVLGGWIGSIVTLIMVALLRKSREAPKPRIEDIKGTSLEKTRTGTNDI